MKDYYELFVEEKLKVAEKENQVIQAFVRNGMIALKDENYIWRAASVKIPHNEVNIIYKQKEQDPLQ